MKKIIVTVVMLMLPIVLTSCLLADNEANPNTDKSNLIGSIQPVDLSEETRRIINALSTKPNNIHVFDLLSSEHESVKIRLWVETFENGNENGIKKDDVLYFSSDNAMGNGNSSEKKQVILSYHYDENTEKTERNLRLSATIVGDRESSGSVSEFKLPVGSVGRFMSPLSSERELQINRPVTLITIIEDSGSTISYSNREVAKYDETGDEPVDILKYDQVMLFRIMLEKV